MDQSSEHGGRDKTSMKQVAAALASLFLFPTAALSERVWTVVYKDWAPEQKIYRYTNFDVSSIVRNGDRVFAATLNNSSRNEIGGAIHTIVADCKKQTIAPGTNIGSKYFRRNGGEWWAEVYLDRSPRFAWNKDKLTTDIFTPDQIKGIEQATLNGDKRYEAMFSFLCDWK